MCELRREPLVIIIIEQFVNFWNRVQCRHRSDLVKIALMENCELANQSSWKLPFWTGHFNSFVGQLCDTIYSLFDQGDNQIDTDLSLESVEVKWGHMTFVMLLATVINIQRSLINLCALMRLYP